MNYQRIYEQLTAKDMIADYTEKHHIIPRCMGGTNHKSNLVRLTPEAHYVAHQLLVKIYPLNEKLVFAANRMASGNQRNNKLYGWIRRKLAIAISVNNKGNPSPNKGKSMSAETKAKISAANIGKPSWYKGVPRSAETKAKISAANKGTIRSAEYLANLRASKKDKPCSNETRAKLSAAHKGKPKSAEHNAKNSAAQKGKAKPKIICPHCNKEGAGSGMSRFHFDKCKRKV